MKKLTLTALIVTFNVITVLAQKPFFVGGSGNLNGGSNVFAGYQFSQKTALIANYYQKDVFSIDILYKSLVLSNGFGLDGKKAKRFTTLLYTPKIFDFDKKWKVFGKIGIDFVGPIKKITKDKIQSIFGVGLRWN